MHEVNTGHVIVGDLTSAAAAAARTEAAAERTDSSVQGKDGDQSPSKSRQRPETDEKWAPDERTGHGRHKVKVYPLLNSPP